MAKPSKTVGKKTSSRSGFTEAKPKTANQELAMSLFQTKDIVVVEGLAGTGKTFLALNYALKEFLGRNVKKIILTRPIITVDNEQLGHLPGSLEEKVGPYAAQLHEYLSEFLPMLALEDEKKVQRDIEFVPLAYMRGRNFRDTIIIADEMQNSTDLQMKTLLTRIAEGSRILVLGDTKQSDRDKHSRGTNNGLYGLLNRLDGYVPNSFGLVKFGPEDVLRSGVVLDVMRLYGDL